MNQKPPVILQVIPALETGGAERTAVDIGDAVTQLGWTSIIASAGGRLVQQAQEGGSLHIELPLESKNPLTLWRNRARLLEIIDQHDVDLVHARSRAPAWSALWAARARKIPFITTYHGAYSQQNAAKAFYNSVMARGDTVIANSQWTADLIADRHPEAKSRIVPIHRGTDFSDFDPRAMSEERLNALRQQWRLPKDAFVIVHLARLTTWKGQSVVIDAIVKLVASNPTVFAVLAGDAQGREAYLEGLKEQIAKHGIADHISLPGHCTDPAAAMALADVVVVASIEAEAFGRAAVEAGALEKPVIVTRIGAVGETVLAAPESDKNSRTGWKVAPGDADDLARSIAEVAALTPAKRLEIGQRARKRALDLFSLERMARETISVYERHLNVR